MIKTENKIEVVGKVTNFKIITSDKTKSKRALITIKDELTNNYTMVTLFEKEGRTYGSKDNKKEVTLGALKNIFLNEKNESRGILITAIGSCSEFVTEKGDLFESNNIYALFPTDDEDNQKSVFNIEGFVESSVTFESKDEEGEEIDCLRIKLGTLSKNADGNITGVNFKTVVVRGGDAFDVLEDIEVGSIIQVGGDIINKMAPKDKYGISSGNSIREYRVGRAIPKIEVDDIEESDKALYKRAKKLKKGESIDLKEVKEEDFD